MTEKRLQHVKLCEEIVELEKDLDSHEEPTVPAEEEEGPHHYTRVKKETKSAALEPDESLRQDISEMRSMLEVLVAEAPEDGVPQEFVPYYRMLLDKGVTREVSAGLVAKRHEQHSFAVKLTNKEYQNEKNTEYHGCCFNDGRKHRVCMQQLWL